MDTVYSWCHSAWLLHLAHDFVLDRFGSFYLMYLDPDPFVHLLNFLSRDLQYQRGIDGVHVNSQDENGRSILMTAAKHCQPDVVEFLLPDKTGNAPAVKGNNKMKVEIDDTDKAGETALTLLATVSTALDLL